MSLAERLEEFKKSSLSHAFWADDFSASEWLLQTGRTISSAKLTDAYLLQLAATQKGALATFDLRIEPSLIGRDDVEVLDYIPAEIGH